MPLFDQLLEKLSTGDKPNQFTLGMGSLIKKAREESGFTQRELASKIYRRQAALSAIENGLMQPDAETLLLLSHFLHKPLDHFYPKPFKPDLSLDDLSEDEKSLIIQTRRLSNDDLKRIIAQVKAIAQINNQEEKT